MFATQTFAQFTQNWINQWAASMSTPDRPVTPNLPQGNIALAIAQADANQATVLQYMAIVITQFARATTCTGPDLDSWMAQFSFDRIQSQYANGIETFSSNVVLTQAAFIPVGTVVQTPGGAIQYLVIADNTLPTFNSSTQAYQIPVGQTSTNVRVQAAIPGSAYNVQPGQLSQLVDTIFGVSSVTNALVIQSGSNAESDDAYRARFVEYINGLSKATETAISEAITSLQTGLKIKLIENVIAVGNPPTSFITTDDNVIAYGNIVALIDDGSGAPSSELLTQARASVASTVAFGIRYQVLQPAIVAPPIALNVRFKAGCPSPATELSNIALQIWNWTKALPIGGETDEDTNISYVYLSQVDQQAFIASPVWLDAIQPHSTTIDGVEDDFVIEEFEEVVIDLTDIAVGTY